MQPIGPSCKVKKRIMNHRIRFRHVSEDEWHHESYESDEWKKEKTREPKYSRLQSFLRIRSIRQIRGTFNLLKFGK